MNISDAINAAADHIEKFPHKYEFSQGQVARGHHPDGGYPACMLARIGEMAGFAFGVGHGTVATTLLGLSAEEFYHMVRQEAKPSRIGLDAVYDAENIPGALRKVAKRYEGIPIQIREIFKGSRAAEEEFNMRMQRHHELLTQVRAHCQAVFS